ncbi:TRAP transporter large permease [Aminivibrio sp.]|jgi:tripartite ATP-independent transporter DctM subunit|uniref:TRAP transporter large permease n=1 Tax=Aminivibrio sp. TaxID=1872489 RepID=UPI00169326E7|nr:TRAP transporter large permease [Synergistaceae bacterium]
MGISMLFAFLGLMVMGVPLFISLLSTSLLGIIMLGDFSLLRVMSQQFFGGMDVFSLMAIPFFILAGILMNRSGLTDRLLDFSRLLVGSVRGGLGYVNVVGGIILAGVNGSAAADASALGSILIPPMVKDGFSPSYAAGLTAGSALIGPIIPPSIFMIIYATMTNTSIGGLFAAGILPGLLLGGAFMGMNYVYSHRYQVPVADFTEVRKRKKEILVRSLVALFAPVIIIGGIVTGIVTPTESGALAVGYCIAAGVFYTRKLTLGVLAESFYETVRLSSSIFLIMGAATVIGWLLKWEQVPQRFASIILQAGLVERPWLLMVVLSAIIFPVGMFMEEVSTLALLTPIFAPIAMKAGIDPFHFGVVMTLNVTIALITPPMGACNYIVAAVGRVKLSDVFLRIWPFIGVALLVLLAIISFPPLTTLLPRMLDL